MPPRELTSVKLFSTLRMVLVCGLVATANGGCRPQDNITQYDVPKVEAIQLPTPTGKGSASNSAGEPQRMLGAIIPHDGQFWFLKLTGPLDAVASRVAEFRQVVQSMTFNDSGKPQWTLPGGWSQQPSSGLRFATLVIDTQPPLETSVTVLPAGEGDQQEGVLANLNRWRGQLSLPPMKSDQLSSETETLTLPKDHTAVFVNLEGQAKAAGGMGGPFAGGRGGFDRPMAAPPMNDAANATASPLKMTAPPDWRPGKSGGMRKAAYEIEGAAGKGEVTMIDLAKAAGDRLANVNRWAGQIGAKTYDAEGLKAALQPIEVGSDTGDYAVLIAPPDAEKGQSILGVIIDKGDKTWFIKLQATTALALQEKAAFEAFVKSVQLP